LSEQPPSSRGFWLRIAISIPVLVGTLWLVFSRADGGAIVASFAGVKLGWLAASIGLMALLVIQRLWRWLLLVHAVAEVPTRTVGRVGLIGYMAIDLLPVRTGEFVRPLLLQRQAGVKFGAGMATCVVERVMDLVAVLLLLLGTLAFADLPSLVVTVFDRPVDLAIQGRNVVLLAALVFGLPGVILVLAGERGETALRALLRPFPEPLRKMVMGLSIAYRDATRDIGRPVLLLQTGALTITSWTFNLWVQWTLMEAFGLTGFGFWQIGFLTLVVAIALMLPSPAGGLGVFEGGTVAGLALFSVDPSVAAAFAVALHGVHVGVITVFGVGALGAEGLRFSDMWKKAPA
jgi:glycosyltransferase 2 family protein